MREFTSCAGRRQFSLLKANKERIKPRLLALALKDEKPQVRSQALKTLNKYFKADADFKAAVENKLSDSSNIVKAAAFKIVAENDKNKAEQIAKQYESSKSGDMLNAVATFYKEQGDPADNDFFLNAIDKTRRYDRFLLIDTYTGYLKKIDVKYWEKGIRKIGAIGAKVTANLGTTTIRNSLDRLQDEIESRLKDPNTDKNEINELTSMKQTLQEQINLLKKKQE